MNKNFPLLFILLLLISTSLLSQNREFFDIKTNNNLTIFKDKSSDLYNTRPLDIENHPVEYNIMVSFKKERYELETNIFSSDELSKLKKLKPFIELSISSKTKKITSISFVFSNIYSPNDYKFIDQKKLFYYKQLLLDNIEIKQINFQKEIKKDGYIRISFRVFMNNCHNN